MDPLSKGGCDTQAFYYYMKIVLFDAYDAGAALYSTGKVIALDTSIVVNQFRAATPTLR